MEIEVKKYLKHLQKLNYLNNKQNVLIVKLLVNFSIGLQNKLHKDVNFQIQYYYIEHLGMVHQHHKHGLYGKIKLIFF